MNFRFPFIWCLCVSIAVVASCGVEPGAGASSPSQPVETEQPVVDEPSADSSGDETPDPVTDTDSGDDIETVDEPVEEPVEPEPTVCDEASDMFALCESPLPSTCEAPEQAECLLGVPTATDGYCQIEAGGERCDRGEPSRALYEWCAVESCLGTTTYLECVDTYSADCTPQVCEEIEALVGQCEGYGYDCPQRDPVEAACLLEVFEALGTPCGLFVESPLCMGPVVSEWGFGSCHVQNCTGVTTFEDCYANLEILCSVSGF